MEFKNLEQEEERTKQEKDELLKSKNLIEADLEREKNIVLDAKSNEKRLNEEKDKLIDVEKKYFVCEQTP